MVNKVAIYSCCALTYQIIWQHCAVLHDVLAQMVEQYLYTNSDVTVPFTANTWGQNYCFSMPFLFQVAMVSEVEILSDLFLSFFSIPSHFQESGIITLFGVWSSLEGQFNI